MIGKTTFETGSSFEPIPSGKYTLQLVEGNLIQETFKGEEKTKVKFTFVVLNDIKFKGADGKEQSTRGRKLWQRFSIFLTPKSYLFGFVKILDPKIINMTDDERKVYDIDALAGRQIDALVSKEPSADGTKIWNNITTFEKNETPLTPMDDVEVGSTPVVKASIPLTAPTATADELKELGL